MRKVLYAILPIFILMFSECQKLEDSDENIISGNSKTILNVLTRASESSIIEYPLYLYAFDEDGNLKASQKLNSDANAINLELNKGKYRIVALSGVGDDYQISDNPTLSSLITLKNGYSSTSALMIGIGDVALSESKTNVTIMMNYAVSSISVFLDNILSNAKKVYFVISSAFSSLSFNNDYSNLVKDVSIECKLGADGKWIAGPMYFFPTANEKNLVSIIVQDDENTNTFSYTYNGKIEIGTPFIINGSYNSGILLGGDIMSSGWKESVNIDFPFGSSVNNEGESSVQTGNVPKIGTLWNGTIVADVGDTENNKTELLLLSTKIWESTIEQASSFVDSYSVNDIKGWRIPTYQEATFLRKLYNGTKLDELNQLLKAAGEYKIYGDEDTRYICYGKESGYASFRFADNSNIVKVDKPEKYYYLRAVTKYVFTEN